MYIQIKTTKNSLLVYEKLINMKFYIVSIFPEIFDSFLGSSIIKKSIDNKKLKFEFINPRNYSNNKHRQVDDTIYWWWKWMLLKAKPIIDAVDFCIKKIKSKNFKIIYLAPSKKIFNQEIANNFSKLKNIILVSGRYEWIDYRFEQFLGLRYPDKFEKISLWKFILMWWETASMVIIESISRLIDWVIKEKDCYIKESYDIDKKLNNIEYPQYTKPKTIYWMDVPDILISWNHKQIEKWKQDNEQFID